jgi:histidyl-tRNA synthetase
MMIFEHEIPSETKLYFGESAKLKRSIERIASDVLYDQKFEEIVTPLFSYHQHQVVEDERELVRVSDAANHHMTLRADSTIDVVRIITKRLGKNSTHKKWFYVQPVYRYPSREQHQVGAEVIGERDVTPLLDSAVNIFKALNVTPLLQISNIAIPLKISKELDIPLSLFKQIEIDKLLAYDVDWLKALVYMEKVSDIDVVIEQVPEFLKEDLRKLKELGEHVEYDNVVLAPLYYAKMRYYDELFFRFIADNRILSRGGRYEDEGLTSSGFALYTDDLIEYLEDSK